MRRISYEDGRIFTFGPDLTPIASVENGETFEVVCQDAGGGAIREESDLLSKLDLDRVNGATGPIEVRGAKAGDVLRVRIRSIQSDDRGWIATGPTIGVLGEHVDELRTKIVPIRKGIARFSSRVSIRIQPHIGTIGLATAGPRLSTFYPHDHGGNLDTKEIAAGNAVFLPVAQAGAQLALGDIHAIMADGEVCGTGIEIGGTVRVTTDLMPGVALRRPVVETRQAWIALGSAPTLDEAARIATSEGVALLVRSGMSPGEAYMLASIACDLRISQDVDPNRTCKLVIPKRFLPDLPRGPVRGRRKGEKTRTRA